MRRERVLAQLPRLLSVAEIASQTGVPASTWYTVIARGELEHVRVGRAVRVPEAELRRWIDSHTEQRAS